LLALARAKPNAISFASSGPASPHQMAMELLLHRAGVEMVHIAYKGAAPAVQDVIAGHVPIMMLDVATGREPIKSGLLKALASASPTRLPDFPELPTIAELGFPGYEASAWQKALPSALPVGRNSPQKVAYGLYAEQLSGSPFTAPQATNQRSWLYRIRPTVRHIGRLARIDRGNIRTAPEREDGSQMLIQRRWGPGADPE